MRARSLGCDQGDFSSLSGRRGFSSKRRLTARPTRGGIPRPSSGWDHGRKSSRLLKAQGLEDLALDLTAGSVVEGANVEVSVARGIELRWEGQRPAAFPGLPQGEAVELEGSVEDQRDETSEPGLRFLGVSGYKPDIADLKPLGGV